jgi:hypothetical protein
MTILEEPIKMILDIKNYIGNEWIESKGEIVDVVNPATLKVIARVPISTENELKKPSQIGEKHLHLHGQDVFSG